MGELTLESPSLGAVLWYENQGRQFVVFDHTGRRESVLHLLAAAAPRVPYEVTPAWPGTTSCRAAACGRPGCAG